MSSLRRRFQRLTPQRRLALLIALPVVMSVRLMLWVVRFRWLHGRIQSIAARRLLSRRITSHDAAWAVATVSRYVPQATCLTQAIALYVMLLLQGVRSRIHLGVAHDIDAGLRAHAWLELDDVVLIGGENNEGYTRLLELQEEAQ